MRLRHQFWWRCPRIYRAFFSDLLTHPLSHLRCVKRDPYHVKRDLCYVKRDPCLWKETNIFQISWHTLCLILGVSYGNLTEFFREFYDTQCNTQCNTHCNTLQHTAAHYLGVSYGNLTEFLREFYNTLQRTMQYTLQHTATHCSTLFRCVVWQLDRVLKRIL